MQADMQAAKADMEQQLRTMEEYRSEKDAAAARLATSEETQKDAESRLEACAAELAHLAEQNAAWASLGGELTQANQQLDAMQIRLKEAERLATGYIAACKSAEEALAAEQIARSDEEAARKALEEKLMTEQTTRSREEAEHKALCHNLAEEQASRAGLEAELDVAKKALTDGISSWEADKVPSSCAAVGCTLHMSLLHGISHVIVPCAVCSGGPAGKCRRRQPLYSRRSSCK